MQVNSISSAQNFQGRKRDNVEAFIHLDDSTIQQLAYAKTAKTVNDKHHRKLNNRLINLVPVAAGVATAALGNFTRVGKLVAFATTTAGCFAGFGIIDAVFGAKRKLNKNSEASAIFAYEYPILDFAATAGIALGAICGARKGFNKLVNKVPKKTYNKVVAYLRLSNNKLNKSRVLNSIAKVTDKVLTKTPSAMKEAGKTVLEWSPFILAGGAMVHSIIHTVTKYKVFANNYNDLKNKQEQLAKLRIAELKTERDGLLQD